MLSENNPPEMHELTFIIDTVKWHIKEQKSCQEAIERGNYSLQTETYYKGKLEVHQRAIADLNKLLVMFNHPPIENAV